jgi:uncharacterized protein YraI
MIKFIQRTAAVLLLLAFLPACTLRAHVPASQTAALPSTTHLAVTRSAAETPAAQDGTSQPTAELQANPTSQPTATVQPVPDQPATITADGVNLRQGPGTLFVRLGMLAEGTKVTVTGKALGDDWVYIDTGDRQGWVSAAFTSLYSAGLMPSVPLLKTGDALVIHGQVTDTSGAPLVGVEFAASQGSADANPPDTRAHSLADGSFYLYLPHGSSGAWQVSMTAVDCKSAIVDANCNFLGAFTPRIADVMVPAENVIGFKYSK